MALQTRKHLDPNPLQTALFNLKEAAIGLNSPLSCEHRRRKATNPFELQNKSISKTILPSPQPIRPHLSHSLSSPRAARDQLRRQVVPCRRADTQMTKIGLNPLKDETISTTRSVHIHPQPDDRVSLPQSFRRPMIRDGLLTCLAR
jgi:hypothetical protein